MKQKKSKCYHTKGPRVWAHTLDQAVEKYKHAKKAEFSFKTIFTGGTSTNFDAFECPPPSKKSKFSGDISIESHQSVEPNEDEGDTIQKDIEEQKKKNHNWHNYQLIREQIGVRLLKQTSKEIKRSLFLPQIQKCLLRYYS